MGSGRRSGGARLPRGARRGTARDDERSGAPQVPLIALQHAAGNRAVAAMLAGGARGPGAVQRQPADARPAGTADPRNLAPRPVVDLRPTGLMYEDPETSSPRPHGDTWNVEFSMFGKPEVFTGLDDENAIKKLESFYFAVVDDMRLGRQVQESWRQENTSSYRAEWAATWSAAAGRAEFPDPAGWGAPPR